MAIKDIPEAIRNEIQQAFLDADNKIRALPEEYHKDFCDSVLLWALYSYLPMSEFHRGIWAYAIHPDDQHMVGGKPVFVAHAHDIEDVEALMSAETVA